MEQTELERLQHQLEQFECGVEVQKLEELTAAFNITTSTYQKII